MPEEDKNLVLPEIEGEDGPSVLGVSESSSSTGVGSHEVPLDSEVEFETSGSVVRNSIIKVPGESSATPSQRSPSKENQIEKPYTLVGEAIDATPIMTKHAAELRPVRSSFSTLVQEPSPDKGEVPPQPTTCIQIEEMSNCSDEWIRMGNNCGAPASLHASPSTVVAPSGDFQVMETARATVWPRETVAGIESPREGGEPRALRLPSTVQESKEIINSQDVRTVDCEVCHPRDEEENPMLSQTTNQQLSVLVSFRGIPTDLFGADGKAVKDQNSVVGFRAEGIHPEAGPLEDDAADNQRQNVNNKSEESSTLEALYTEGKVDLLLQDSYTDGDGENQTTYLPQPDKRKSPISAQDGVGDGILEHKHDVFCPSDSFTGEKPGYIFKLGDQGLGFYINGYVDTPKNAEPILIRQPWNAGPGDKAIRRGPLGPVHKPFKNIKNLRDRSNNEADDTRQFMARMVAQRNSRAFQNTLLGRQHALDKRILALLENIFDPTFFKKKHGYNVHGEMLGKDGKMIVKIKAKKTEEETAKLSWYRKIYEDRLGEHLPTKRLGDSIEARREAYAYSRHFTTQLNDRQDDLNRSLTETLKGQTRLDFIMEDYHYPGAYDTDGLLIREKGAKRSNKLDQNDEQKNRAYSYRFRALQRYRAAHDDIVEAISKKDKALQGMFRKTDPMILGEIADEAVQSSGIGIYRQKARSGPGDDAKRKISCVNVTAESTSQLRKKFAAVLEAKIKSKDKALMKEVAAMENEQAVQMIDDFAQGVQVLPSSWRQDPRNLKHMHRRRKELIAQIAADQKKVVSPWRPAGLHIAHEPWRTFTPRNRQPHVCSGSVEKSGVDPRDAVNKGQRVICQSDGKLERRAHTVSTHRRNNFMGTIVARARRILAAHTPGTALHTAFSIYSNDPFSLDHRGRLNQNSGSTRRCFTARDCSQARVLGSCSGTIFQSSGNNCDEQNRRASAKLSELPTCGDVLPAHRVKNTTRPHSAIVDKNSRMSPTERRPSTASGINSPACANTFDSISKNEGMKYNSFLSAPRGKDHDSKNSSRSRSFYVRSGPGVTVRWARCCGSSSDVAYKRSTWPSTPRAPSASRPTRRRARPSASPATDEQERKKPGSTRWQGFEEREALKGRSEISSRKDARITSGNAEAETSLEDLEKSLLATTCRRVDQRKHVFSAYRKRSRRARIWDPCSAFYDEGTCMPVAGRSPTTGRGKVGAPENASHQTKTSAELCSCEGRCCWSYTTLDADPPVDMDWKRVDTDRFSQAAQEMRAALEERLFPAVTSDRSSDGELEECLREAQQIVKSGKRLFQYPGDTQETFEQEGHGVFRIEKYVTTVSMINALRAAASGVVDIVSLVRKREELLQAFCKNEQLGAHRFGANVNKEAHKTDIRAASSYESLMSHYQERLELADHSTAILESLCLWLSLLPWRMRILYDGKCIISKLEDEEQGVAWPPYPDLQSLKNSGDTQTEETISHSEGDQMPLYGPQRCGL